MNKFIKYNILYASIDILKNPPFNLKYNTAKKKITQLKKEGVLYKIDKTRYFYLPVLNKYVSLYGYRIVGLLINNGYVGLFTAAKKWGLVKQEHTNNLMYISDTPRYKEYLYYYDKFNYYNYRLFKGYTNSLIFGIYNDVGKITYSDKEKTILDLIYYSLYSKFIKIDSTMLEKSIKLDYSTIERYIKYYPINSQNKIIKKLHILYK